jgi:hypothetical protein
MITPSVASLNARAFKRFITSLPYAVPSLSENLASARADCRAGSVLPDKSRDSHFGRYDTSHSRERGPPARTKQDTEVCLRRVWRPALLTETETDTASHSRSEVRAERLIAEELGRLAWNEAQLRERRKSDPAKLALAARSRRETTLTVGWIANRLHLGTRKSAAVKLHRCCNTKQKVEPD